MAHTLGRLASRSISGDSPVAGFSIPIDCIDFRATFAADGTIAVDLIDLNTPAY